MLFGHTIGADNFPPILALEDPEELGLRNVLENGYIPRFLPGLQLLSALQETAEEDFSAVVDADFIYFPLQIGINQDVRRVCAGKAAVIGLVGLKSFSCKLGDDAVFQDGTVGFLEIVPVDGRRTVPIDIVLAVVKDGL